MCERLLGVEDKLHRSPVYYVNSGDRACEGLRYANDDGRTLDVIGETGHVIQYAEGQTWVETVDGYGLAEGYLKENTRFRQAEIKPLVVNIREGLHSPLNETAGLWELEDLEGCQLLSGEIRGNFDKGDCLTRKLTQKERRREERKKAIERGEEVDGDLSDDPSNSDGADSDFGGDGASDLSEWDNDNSDESEEDDDEAETADYI